MSFFVIIIKYKVDTDVIDIHRSAHLEFLDTNYDNGNFIISGPQIPRNGGIIIAKSNSRSEVEELIKNDPFYLNQLSDYEIYEFNPTKTIKELDTKIVK